MPWPFNRAIFSWALLLALTGIPLAAQTNRPSGKELDSYVKALLSDYYTGKPVRAQVVIPATERGLVMVDGRLEATPTQAGLPGAAQPGDVLVISRLTFKHKSIEVQFGGDDPGDEKTVAGGQRRLTNDTQRRPALRLTLRFSHEITQLDLSIQNLNRLLAKVVDVSKLAPETPPAPAVESPPKAPAANTANADPQSIPSATVVADLTGTSAGVGELTVECSVGRARVYLDDAYSGWTPRTVKLTAGVHSVLIVAEGYAMWEQKFFIPGAKASLVRAELRPAIP